MARQSTTPTCPHCGTPTKDAPLCRDAEQTLHALLRQLCSTVPTVLRNGEYKPLPDDGAGRQPSTRWDTLMGERGALPRLLDEAVGRQARFATAGTKVQTTTTSRTPLPSRAGDRAATLHALVVRAANDLISAQMCVQALPLAVETTTAAEWLLAGFDRLRLHPGAADLYWALQAAVAGAENAVDRPADRRYLGPCDLTQQTCDGEVYAVGDKDATCSTCGRTLDTLQRRHDLETRAEGLWLTAREIDDLTASLHGPAGRIPKSNVTSWHSRGRLAGSRAYVRADEENMDEDELKAARVPVRFRYGDVVKLAEQSRRRSSRRSA